MVNDKFIQNVYELIMSEVISFERIKEMDGALNAQETEILNQLYNLRDALEALSRGELETETKGSGYLIDCLNRFKTALRHLVHQANAVSEGCFDSKVEAMGDISNAFNAMVKRLDEAFKEYDRLRQETEESERRHRLLADNATDVIWTMKLNGQFTYISPSVIKLRGYTPEEVMSQAYEQILCPESLAQMIEGLALMRKHIEAGEKVPTFRGQLEQPHKNGGTIWTEATISGLYDEDGRFIEILGISRDITEQKKLESEIIKISVTDKLTQIHNRLKLESLLEEAYHIANTQKMCFQIVIFDIDKFKRINDRYGHPTGDLVLMELTQHVKQLLKPYKGVSFGRWGGEEFMLVVKNLRFSETALLLENIRAAIEAYTFSIPETVTCSFGMAQYAVGKGLTDLILSADQAMYNAKSSGRNCVRIEGEDMDCIQVAQDTQQKQNLAIH